jgi:hypothetical protein
MQSICTARQDNVASQPKFWLAKDEETHSKSQNFAQKGPFFHINYLCYLKNHYIIKNHKEYKYAYSVANC